MASPNFCSLREAHEGKTTSERYICDSDPYRSTTLPIPLPFPLAMESSPELELRLRFLRLQIYQDLRENGLSSEAHVIPYMVSPVFDPAKGELLALLQSHNINDVHVEIRDIDLNFSALLFAILPNYPIVTIYEDVKHEVIDILRQNIPSKWHLFYVFRVGQMEETATPSFVVLVDPMTSANWSQLSLETKSIMLKSPGVSFLKQNGHPLDARDGRFFGTQEVVTRRAHLKTTLLGHRMGRQSSAPSQLSRGAL